MEKLLSRRRFIVKGGQIGAAVVLATNIAPERKQIEDINKNAWIEEPDKYKYKLKWRQDLNDRYGKVANVPFLWQYDEPSQREVLAKIRPSYDTVRIFLNYKLEPENLGGYDETVIKRVLDTAEVLKDFEMNLMADAYDGIDNRRGVNFVWGIYKPKGPYTKDGEVMFYKGEKYQDGLLFRIKFILKHLKKLENFKALGLVNEPAPPLWPGGEEAFFKWMMRVPQRAKDELGDIDLVAGVADPRIIPDEAKGFDIATLHIYKYVTQMMGLKEFIKNYKLPVFVQEFGAEDGFFGIQLLANADRKWRGFFRNEVLNLITETSSDNEIAIHTVGAAPWQLGLSKDGYRLDLQRMPMIARDLFVVNQIMKGGKVK